jgi:Cytochrome c biogenesis factor
MLTWLFGALPPTAKGVFTTGRKKLPKLRAEGITAKSKAARLRLIGSHLAHLGLILLLLGHVLTTTWVERAEPSHLVTLQKENPVEFKEYELTFSDTVWISEEEPEYDYKIGEGFAGFVMEGTKEGEKVDEMTPGNLRFRGKKTGSEVERRVRPSGKKKIILEKKKEERSLT